MSADVNYDHVSRVKASTYREAAVEELHDGPATPSEIADASPHEIAHISRALQELRDDGIVELLVSEERRKARIYGLTDDGKAVGEFLDDREVR